MSCSARTPQSWPRPAVVKVNGVVIARDLIAREVQHHPAASPAAAWLSAASALVVKELLIQEARRHDLAIAPLSDGEGRRETDDEAAIRALIAREIQTPEPDEETCRRYYDRNRHLFRSADIYEAAHILVAACADDEQRYAEARHEAQSILGALQRDPTAFAELARLHSACPSAASGGHLGQITAGDTTPEFERALRTLEPGAISLEPVATRYGLHIIRLDRKQPGRELPFSAVAERIASYLRDSVHHKAIAQYLARLGRAAKIEGVTLPTTDALRVH